MALQVARGYRVSAGKVGMWPTSLCTSPSTTVGGQARSPNSRPGSLPSSRRGWPRRSSTSVPHRYPTCPPSPSSTCSLRCDHWPRPEERTHHLHLIEHDDLHARALIAFRDALRADANLRADYTDLKNRLARQHRQNRNSYTNAKSEFVAHVLRGAGIDPPPRDRLAE